MVAVRTADNLAQEAQQKNEKALEILNKEDFGAEDMDTVKALREDAQSLFERSQAMVDINAERQKALKQFGPGNVDNAADQNEHVSTDQPDPLDGYKSLGHYFKAIYHLKANGVVSEPGLKWVSHDDNRAVQIDSQKALAENVGATGGFLVPAEFQARLLSVMETESIVRQRAEVIPMARRTVSIPVLDQTSTSTSVPSFFGGMQAFWTEEATQLEESDPDFRQITLTAHTLTAYTRVSDTLLDDSAISLEAFLMGSKGFPGIINWTTDYAFLRGDGVGKPSGVVDADCTITVARDTAGQVGYEDLTEMLSNAMMSSGLVWVISQNAMNQLLTLQGPSGNPEYLWGNAVSGAPNTLLGYPVIWTDKLPALGTRGDVLLADFSYYLVGDRQQTTVAMSNDERFRYNQTSWKANHRVDGQPWLSAPITYVNQSTVSPFVVLGDVAT